MIHIDDWLDEAAKDPAEKWAKEFLEHCRRPAIAKDYAWLAKNPLFCTYRGKRYRCTGASRLGDVWLVNDFGVTRSYDLRVDVAECSDWTKAAPPPPALGQTPTTE